MDANTKVIMFASRTSEWETPQELFDELDKEFNFDTDLCASDKNAKCSHYIKKNECYYCNRCIEVCPKDAIEFSMD